MYTGFYNLDREPFHITPDPDFLFLSDAHKEALAAVIYGVEQRKGFVAIIGEVGLGKTTILRSFLERIDEEHTKIIYIFNSNISFKGLLQTIYQNLGCQVQSDDIVEMVNRLHQILIEKYKKGMNVVLIIDEAQNMPLKTLENLRMLSNLETSTEKLIQIVFSGQPEFEELLNTYQLRQLKQRIAIRANITPFSEEESLAYIRHRLAKANGSDSEIFTRGALKKIIKHADGIPRVINILCDNCLISAFGLQQKKVKPSTVKEIISDIERRNEGGSSNWSFLFLSIVLILVGVIWVYLLKNML